MKNYLIYTFIFLIILFPLSNILKDKKRNEAFHNSNLIGLNQVFTSNISQSFDNFEKYIKEHNGLKPFIYETRGRFFYQILGITNNTNIFRNDNNFLFYLENKYQSQNSSEYLNKNLKDFVSYIHKINAYCKEHEIKFTVLVAPKRNVSLAHEFPKYILRKIDRINPNKADFSILSELDGIDIHYLTHPLKEMQKSKSIFKKNDIHWNYKGALAGYNVLRTKSFNKDKLDFATLNYTQTLVKGHLAKEIGMQDQLLDTDYSIKNPFSTFKGIRELTLSPMPNDYFAPITIINNKIESTDKVLFYHDSYGGYLSSFTGYDFKTSYFLNPYNQYFQNKWDTCFFNIDPVKKIKPNHFVLQIYPSRLLANFEACKKYFKE